MAEEPLLPNGRINLDKPRWNQDTFMGRLKHFAWITDYRTCITSNKKLLEARELVEQYRRARKLYESAFHPDSGELQNVPGGLMITAGMLHFYKSNSAVILWQWINQSFNVLVNYTNRNAATEVSNKKVMIAYLSASSSAILTAIGLKRFLALRASSLFQRFVPFAAVAAANMVNIPLSRQNELQEGVALFDDNGQRITESRYAAVKGIVQVTSCRIVMAAPGMLIIPVIMERMERRAWFRRATKLHIPLQAFLLGCSLTCMVPITCAIFPQRSSIGLDRLSIMDSGRLAKVKESYGDSAPKTLYFNKGL